MALSVSSIWRFSGSVMHANASAAGRTRQRHARRASADGRCT
jgi:hypothetical protein